MTATVDCPKPETHTRCQLLAPLGGGVDNKAVHFLVKSTRRRRRGEDVILLLVAPQREHTGGLATWLS